MEQSVRFLDALLMFARWHSSFLEVWNFEPYSAVFSVVVSTHNLWNFSFYLCISNWPTSVKCYFPGESVLLKFLLVFFSTCFGLHYSNLQRQGITVWLLELRDHSTISTECQALPVFSD